MKNVNLCDKHYMKFLEFCLLNFKKDRVDACDCLLDSLNELEIQSIKDSINFLDAQQSQIRAELAELRKRVG